MTLRPAAAGAAVQPFLPVFKVVPLALGVGSSLQGRVAGSAASLSASSAPRCFRFPLTTYNQLLRIPVGPPLSPPPPAPVARNAGSCPRLRFCVCRAVSARAVCAEPHTVPSPRRYCSRLCCDFTQVRHLFAHRTPSFSVHVPRGRARPCGASSRPSAPRRARQAAVVSLTISAPMMLRRVQARTSDRVALLGGQRAWIAAPHGLSTGFHLPGGGGV